MTIAVTQRTMADDSAALSIDQYNVVFDSPCKDAHGSMPLGNSDIGKHNL